MSEALSAQCIECLVPKINPSVVARMPDLQIVVHPGNLVSRKNLSSKKILRKIDPLFVDNNCFSKTFFNIHNFLWRLSKFGCENAVDYYFFNLTYVRNWALLWEYTLLKITHQKEKFRVTCPGSKEGDNYLQF